MKYSWVTLLAIAALLGACDRKSNDVAELPVSTGTKDVGEASIATSTHPDRVFWGDLHLHSSYSFDSYSFGNEQLTPAEAFRFAKGEEIGSTSGSIAKLDRPLDFLLVSDHAEYLGILVGIAEESPALLASELGSRWAGYTNSKSIRAVVDEYIGTIEGRIELTDYMPEAFQRSTWHDLNTIAERFNEPGKFTAFIGYEWTSMIDGKNLHRNVIFRDGIEKTKEILPFSALDDNDPEGLWAFLEGYEKATGGQVIAIPHNGNLSNGLMFSDDRINGSPVDRSYAETRARWEPVYEMTQVKGDGESHPMLSPDDEFADFENWSETDIAMNPKPADQMKSMLTHEYARAALKIGLQFEASTGVNPFKFGLVGSTDSHTGLATADSDNFFGKFMDSEPAPDRLTSKMGGILWLNRFLSASGYAGIWATENTRAALFDALKRREVYATTGPRIVVRLFGGWDFTSGDLASADYAERAYNRGVPMGGELGQAPAGASPAFIVTAARDPQGANLDRVQIIKGWLDGAGNLQEAVYNVAASDDRMANAVDGKITELPVTVDVSTASYENSVGAAELATVWTDPDFDPPQKAFYYARVIEIATPRWTTYDAARFNRPLPEDVPTSIQERAYTSPIWYSPAAP